MSDKLIIDGVEYDRSTFSEEAKSLDQRIARINFLIEEKKRDIDDLYIVNDTLVGQLVNMLNLDTYSTSYLPSRPTSAE